eukprot:XP_001706881.1 Hypothetical protein GL50803_93862 [Giardia lamblia ATCC 50803]
MSARKDVLSLRRMWSASSITTCRSFRNEVAPREAIPVPEAGLTAVRRAETIQGVPQMMYDVLSSPYSMIFLKSGSSECLSRGTQRTRPRSR